MKDTVVLNENRGRFEAGDILIFRSSESAQRYIEIEDVISGTYVGVFGDGTPAIIRNIGNTIIVERSLDAIKRSDLLEHYLQHHWRSRPDLRDLPFPSNLEESLKILGHHR
jgi:hypothetical protein